LGRQLGINCATAHQHSATTNALATTIVAHQLHLIDQKHAVIGYGLLLVLNENSAIWLLMNITKLVRRKWTGGIAASTLKRKV
jgi:hypothetical protein